MAQAVEELDVAHVGLRTLTLVDTTPAQPAAWALAVKRAGDVVAAVVLLVLLAPVMLVVALAVKLTSTGPVLFKQTRVGKGGEHFQMWKFRSMAVDTTERINADPELRRLYEENDFKLPADISFITPVGKLIRKTSLDELPQLFQVLTGKMSIVGVRPLLPQELALRSRADRDAHRTMRPGLTGLWQVEGRSAIAGAPRHLLDRNYVDSWRLARDIAILARTPLAVLNVRSSQ